MNNKSIRSDLAKAKGLGSAKNGTDHWYQQRLTSISNFILVIWMVYSLINLQGASYEEFTMWLATPLNAVLTILFVISSFYHGYLGSMVVVEDYFHNEVLKTIKIIVMKLFFISATVIAIFSVLKVAL